MSAPKRCGRCGGDTTRSNRHGEIIDHPDTDECVSDLVREVYRLRERTENLETQVDSLIAELDEVREGEHQPIAKAGGK